MNENWIAYLELTLAMAVVGSSVVVGKLLIASFPVFLGAGLRFAIASAVLLPMLIGREKGIPSVTRRDWLFLFLQTLTGVFLFSIFLLYGLKWTTAAESGIISSTTPAVLGLISFLFLKERLTRNKAIGIAFTLFGIIAINLIGASTGVERGANPLLGNLLVFGAVVGEALFTIFRKVVSEKVTPLASATVMSVFGLVMFLPFAIYEPGTSIFLAPRLPTGFLSPITALLLRSWPSFCGFGASRKCLPVSRRSLQEFGP